MACSTVNLSKLELETMGREDFHRKFQRTDVKIHDALGVFGAPRFDYFVYQCHEEMDDDGWSNGYLLIASAKSLKRVPSTIKKSIADTFKEKGVDVATVEDQDLVVMAVHEGCVVGQQSMSLYFYPREKDEDEKKREARRERSQASREKRQTGREKCHESVTGSATTRK